MFVCSRGIRNQDAMVEAVEINSRRQPWGNKQLTVEAPWRNG